MPHPDIPIARPRLGPEEEEAAAAVIRSGWIMQGPEVAAFECEFAGHVGASFACAVSSGTAALHLALLAAGVRPGSDVVTVSHSFVATANSIRLCGAEPRFVDIEADTYNMDARLVEAAIGPRTRAVLCVHQLGLPCDLSALAEIARRRGVALVEDAACAAGSEIEWRGRWEPIGRPHADVACFSFHPRKVMTTGDGGMVTTGSAAIDKRVRAWRQHESIEGVTALNYRMTDVQAAIGRVQLRRLPELVAERRRIVDQFRRRLRSVIVPAEPSWARTNWQSLCVRLPAGVRPASIGEALGRQGISTRPGIANAHEPPLATERTQSLPESERAQRETIMLPVVPGMTGEDIERVSASLEAVLRASAVVGAGR